MEENDENVSIGKFLDENTYIKNRKHININNEINLDFIEKGNIIHEIKKSRKIEIASIWQVKYYLYYLKKRGVKDIEAIIDYPLLKKTIKIDLTSKYEETLENILKNISDIVSRENIPEFEIKSICKNCAYEDLCKI